MANRLIRLSPVSITTNTPGASFQRQINVQPITGLENGAGVAVDRGGNVYVTDYTKHVVFKYQRGATASRIFAGAYGVSGSADGQGSVARFNQPSGIACDNTGNLYVVDVGNAKIRKIDPNGNVYTVASIPAVGADTQPGQIAVDDSGNIYYVDSTA